MSKEEMYFWCRKKKGGNYYVNNRSYCSMKCATESVLDFKRRLKESKKEIKAGKIEVCGYCKEPFDVDRWIEDECCSHCGKFLDNPSYIKLVSKKDKK